MPIFLYITEIKSKKYVKCRLRGYLQNILGVVDSNGNVAIKYINI